MRIHLIGSILGLIVVERLVGRIESKRLLTWLALLVLVGVIGLLSVHVIWGATIALVVIGFGESDLYPIAKAEAYGRQPGRSGMVRAVIDLGAPFEVVLPCMVGLIAGHFGILTALGFLGLAPLFILIPIPCRTSKPTHSPT